MLDNLIKKLSTLAELCDHAVSLWLIEDLIELEDVGMVKLLKNFNLMIKRVHLLWRHCFLLHNLNRSDNFGISKDALANLAVGALGNQLSNLIVVFEFACVLLDEILLANLDLGRVSNHFLLNFIYFTFRIYQAHSCQIFLINY